MAVAYGATWPDLPTFRDLARGRRFIPVVRRLLADAETPLGVYRKLAQSRPGTFLLESAEQGGVWSRYSIIGAASRAVLTERAGRACCCLLYTSAALPCLRPPTPPASRVSPTGDLRKSS